MDNFETFIEILKREMKQGKSAWNLFYRPDYELIEKLFGTKAKEYSISEREKELTGLIKKLKTLPLIKEASIKKI